ncbi:MAG: hypothetical protein NVS3B10_16540 [Polyangiales bacterium]
MSSAASLFACALAVSSTIACGNTSSAGPAPDDSGAPEPDSGVDTTVVADEGVDVADSARPDSARADTGTDVPPDTRDAAPPPDAAVLGGCGGESGLQPGSPWPMPGRCPSHQGRAKTSGPTGDKLAWSKALSFGGAGAATVAADGTIYVPSQNPSQIWAFDPTGAVKWTFTLSGYAATGIALGTDGTLYFGSNHKLFYAVSPAGTLRWTFTAGASAITGDDFVTSPAIGADGTLYFGSSDKNLYALNADGTKKWSFANDFSFTNEIVAAPAIAPDGSIVYGTLGSSDGWIVALNADGTLKWKFPTGKGVLAPPAIADDGTVYVGAQDDVLYALAPDGTKKWTFSAALRFYAGASIGAAGTVYVGSEDKNLYALAPDGTLRWTFPIDGDVGAPVAIGLDGTLFLGPQNTTLYALAPDGTVRWTHAFAMFNDDRSYVAFGAKGELYMIGGVDRQSSIVAFAP